VTQHIRGKNPPPSKFSGEEASALSFLAQPGLFEKLSLILMANVPAQADQFRDTIMSPTSTPRRDAPSQSRNSNASLDNPAYDNVDEPYESEEEQGYAVEEYDKYSGWEESSQRAFEPVAPKPQRHTQVPQLARLRLLRLTQPGSIQSLGSIPVPRNTPKLGSTADPGIFGSNT